MLTAIVADRALQCLQRFSQLLRAIPRDHVRVVGTNALRHLRDKNDFLNRAESALGHTIEVIDGLEEARLIYLGVSKWPPISQDLRLVIDIGGGSTEVIVGHGDSVLYRESLELGCVAQSKLFFADGILSAKRFECARLRARQIIQPVLPHVREWQWDHAIGCSGNGKSAGWYFG